MTNEEMIKSCCGRYGVTGDDGILKEHNRKIYSKIIKGFEKSNRVLIEQATGTGKSYIAIKFIKDFAQEQGKKVLFVSPTKVIDDAFVSKCGETIGDISGLNSCLYAGLGREVENNYDIIILDEVHRAGASVWGENVKTLLANNPNAKVLGMTATLERSDEADVLGIIGVDKPVSRLSLGKAIQKEILPAPDYTLAMIGFKEQLTGIERYERDLMNHLQTESITNIRKSEIIDLLGEINEAKRKISESEQIHEVLAKEINAKNLKSGKFIVFCPMGNNSESENASLIMEQMQADAKNEWFSGVDSGVETYAVHSNYGRKFNQEQIRQFEANHSDNIKLLFTVNMLNEGLHVNDIDGVIMLRSTSSNIIYLQQLGRALSVGHNDKPKIFDFVANISKNDAMAQVQRIANEVNKSGDGNTTHNDDNEDIAESKNLPYNKEFVLKIENLEILEFLQSVSQKVGNYIDENIKFNFDIFIAHLQEYKEDTNPDNKKKELKVPIKYVAEDGYKLGQKVQSIRNGRIKLTEEQKEILDEMGFVWDAQVFDFEKFVAHLQEYKAKTDPENKKKELKVPIKYVAEDGYKLGQKVQSIRNGRIKLTEEQRAILDEMGFVWDAKVFDFEKFIAHLQEYKEKTDPENNQKELKVPVKYVAEDGYRLGQNVNAIRTGNIKLTKEQKAILDEMGFVWDATKVFDFEKFVAHLQEYKAKTDPENKEKELKVPVKYVAEDGYRLGQNVSAIRSGDIKLTEEQRAILDEMGFVWDAKVFDFEKFVAHLQEYKEKTDPENKEKELKVPVKYVAEDGYRLGQNVSAIRSGNIKLTEEQERVLNAVGFSWNAQGFDTKKLTIEWSIFQELPDNPDHNLNVPLDYVNEETDYPLGQIAHDVCFRLIDLKEKQIQMLIDAGFPLDEESWGLGDLAKDVLSASQERASEQDNLQPNKSGEFCADERNLSDAEIQMDEESAQLGDDE